jgi:hypothetical protein
MASGHANRTNRPNTWPHRPSLRREESPCQLGAVHTWHQVWVALHCGYDCYWMSTGLNAATAFWPGHDPQCHNAILKGALRSRSATELLCVFPSFPGTSLDSHSRNLDHPFPFSRLTV